MRSFKSIHPIKCFTCLSHGWYRFSTCLRLLMSTKLKVDFLCLNPAPMIQILFSKVVYFGEFTTQYTSSGWSGWEWKNNTHPSSDLLNFSIFDIEETSKRDAGKKLVRFVELKPKKMFWLIVRFVRLFSILPVFYCISYV